MLRALLLLAVGCVGCGGASASAPTRLDDGAIARWSEGRSEPRARALVRAGRTAEPARPAATVRLERPPPSPAARGPRIDVRLERARLVSALRLLAEAAGLSIVIGEGLDQEITVDLRRVRPLEAMRALAAAYGVELAFVGRTVVARRGG